MILPILETFSSLQKYENMLRCGHSVDADLLPDFVLRWNRGSGNASDYSFECARKSATKRERARNGDRTLNKIFVKILWKLIFCVIII